MTYRAGSAVGSYIFDISDVERKAIQLRSIFAGIAQDAATFTNAPTRVAAPISNADTAVVNTYVSQLQNLSAANTQAVGSIGQVIASVRAQAAAMGLSQDQLEAEFAAMSRNALAVGDLTRALALEDAALGKITAAETELVAIDAKAIAQAEAHAKAIQRQADQELRLAGQQARTLKAQGDSAGALQLLTSARNNAAGASAQAVAATETEIATLAKTGSVAGAAASGISSMLGPVALLTTALFGLQQAADQTVEAFKFSTHLEEENRAIGILLRSTRDSGEIFDQAEKFAKRYGLTQQETSDAISDAIPVIRESNQSIEDILTVFTKLTILKPGKTFSDAARAISELQAGQLQSIERIFNIPVQDAREMKHQIEGGRDAITVLNDYLTKSGVGADALANRMEGAAGKIRVLNQEQERFNQALAGQAGGVGAALLNFKIEETQRQTRLFTSDLGTLIAQSNSTFGSLNPLVAVLDHYGINLFNLGQRQQQVTQTTEQNTISYRLNNDAINNAANTAVYANSVLGEEAAKKANSTVETQKLTLAQQDLERDSLAAAQGILGAGDQAVLLASKYGIAEEAARGLIRQQQQIALNNQALLDQRKGEQTGTTLSYQEFNNFSRLQHEGYIESVRDAKTLLDSQISLAQARGDDARAIELLRQKQRQYTTQGSAEYNQLEAQIISIQKSREKPPKVPKPTTGLSGLDRTEIKLAGDLQAQLTEVNRRLAAGHLTQQQRNQLLIQQKELQDKINDAIQKERDLQTNIALDAVHDQQARVKEDRELAALRQAELSDRFSAEEKRQIQLREQEIILEQQKRQNDLSKQSKELNDTIRDSGIGATQAIERAQNTQVTTNPLGGNQFVGGRPIVPLTNVPGSPQGTLNAPLAVTVNLAVTVDKNGVPTVTQIDPGVALNLITNGIRTAFATGSR